MDYCVIDWWDAYRMVRHVYVVRDCDSMEALIHITRRACRLKRTYLTYIKVVVAV